MLISPYISIVTLNVNKLNSPVKRHRIVVWEEKKTQAQTLCCLCDVYLTLKPQIGSK